MSQSPFNMGSGRNGPGAHLQGGMPRVDKVAPYRIDLSDETFTAVNDIIVCTLAPPQNVSKGGIEMPFEGSPFHIVLDVGPKVDEELGVHLDPGDMIAFEGAAFADTMAGRVWFCRAKSVLSVITKKTEEQDSQDAVANGPRPPRGETD